MPSRSQAEFCPSLGLAFVSFPHHTPSSPLSLHTHTPLPTHHIPLLSTPLHLTLHCMPPSHTLTTPSLTHLSPHHLTSLNVLSVGSGLVVDGAHENTSSGPPTGAHFSPAIFANHSGAPNSVMEHWPATDDAPERLMLVTTEKVAAGEEIRFDYENGGSRGQYWGHDVRPCAPQERKWRSRRVPHPPPSGLSPVVRYSARLLKFSRWLASVDRDDAKRTSALEPPQAPRPPPRPPPAAWCDTTLRELIAQLEPTDWLHNCVLKGTGKASLWGVVATHFPPRSPLECQTRWRHICRTDEALCLARR